MCCVAELKTLSVRPEVKQERLLSTHSFTKFIPKPIIQVRYHRNKL